MAQAANEALQGREVLLIGFSGGGTIAVLLAEQLPGVRGVITVAANLDVTGWTELHGYTPLVVDEVVQTLKRLPVRQLHLFGGRDEVVPPQLFRRLGTELGSSEVRFCEVPDFSHTCCWHREWSARLSEFGLDVCASAENGRIVENSDPGDEGS